MSHFAENIRLLRIRKDWSQTELASKVGIDKSLVAHWEAGRRKPTVEGVLLLAKLFEVTVENLWEVKLRENNFFLATQDEKD